VALLFVVAVFGLLVWVYGTSDEMPSSYHKWGLVDKATSAQLAPTNQTNRTLFPVLDSRDACERLATLGAPQPVADTTSVLLEH